MVAGRPAPPVRAQLTLREATAEPVPVPVLTGVAVPKAGLPPADRSVPVMPVNGRPVIGPSVKPDTAIASQPRATRVGASGVAFRAGKGSGGEGAEIPAASASLTLELRLLARHVVGLAIVRSSGSAEFDARVLAAFKAAAGSAVIPDSLPVEGFVVELELEGRGTRTIRR